MPNVSATPPLTLEVLRALANANPVIQIISTPTIATIELDMDIGMRGRLVSIRNDHDDVIKLMIDVSGFESVNKPCASATYFDKNQNPTLTWFESPCYPKDGKATIYLDADFYNADPFFALVSAESSELVAEFLTAPAEVQADGYVKFLESAVFEARTKYDEFREKF